MRNRHRHYRRGVPALVGTAIALTGGISLTAGIVHAGPGTSPGTTIGPGTTVSPYVIPVDPANAQITSLLTVDDLPARNGYTMAGIPDGLGAYDRGDGKVALLSNHEFGATAGTARGPLPSGSFVSAFNIDPATLDVAAGSDLISTMDYAGTTPAAFSRWCSGNLAAADSFYNASSGKGFDRSLFMGGEETGLEGRAHAIDPINGKSWVLPALGRTSFENAVAASTPTSDTTVVMGMNDTSTAGASANLIYVGTKQSGGNTVERAGLTNGSVFGAALATPGIATDAAFRATKGVGNPEPFTLVPLVGATGAALQADAAGKNVFGPDRSEDGAFDPSNPNDFYFVTTGSTPAANGRGGLWRMRFDDVDTPLAGGTLTLLVDHGTSHAATDDSTNQPAFYMPDNITVDGAGHVMIQEDPGNDGYLARVWAYDIATNVLKPVATFDPARFISGQAGFITADEESSGIIDVGSMFGPGSFLFDAQVHDSAGLSNPERDQERGQYMLMKVDFSTVFATLPPDVPEAPLGVMLPLSAAVIGGGWMLVRRRRAATTS